MPENVVTYILDSLPIKDAARTSILSRTWRFKWTMLTQIVFDFDKYYDERDLSIFLLQLIGPVTKFILLVPNNKELDVKDIKRWIMFLSRKGIKEFAIINNHLKPLKLPSHLFSCLELKHLKLCNCFFRLPKTSSGFPNLLSLELRRVTFESGNCGQLITRCPLLEILKVSYHHNPSGKLKLVEIAKLTNLRVLSLPLCKLDYILITIPIISQLGSYFPRLQELNLDFQNSKFPEEFDESEYLGLDNIFPSLRTLNIIPNKLL
uniref:F-box/FBD/LRR-repeat protein At1g13570-like n=1 Tax=Erigeron canadensis TaxID=72917 RepID=UPI001CB94526|nr:F-box/FBD/LRR-repeat protein At1g13570-like [Erigeron canadensis]